MNFKCAQKLLKNVTRGFKRPKLRLYVQGGSSGVVKR